jgi:hypothetical protein
MDHAVSRVVSRLLLLLAALLAWASGSAQEAAEQQVKAAYLYRFAGYVEWPEGAFSGPDTPIVFAIVGDEAVAVALTQAVSGRTVNERRLAVRRFKPGEALAGVHVLFVGRAEGARLRQMSPAAYSQSILMVTDAEGDQAQGAVINFVLAERRVRFEVSLESAERSKLRLSSRLLAVAHNVRQGL